MLWVLGAAASAAPCNGVVVQCAGTRSVLACCPFTWPLEAARLHVEECIHACTGRVPCVSSILAGMPAFYPCKLGCRPQHA
jgi:hypothetical protein